MLSKAIGPAVMLILAGLVCPAWVQADPGIRFLGPDAMLAIVVKPQQVWESPLRDALPHELLDIESRDFFGVLPGDVVSVMTIIGAPSEEGESLVGVVVRTNKPVQLEDLFPSFQEDGILTPAEHPATGKTYLSTSRLFGLDVYQVDETTVLLAPPESLSPLLRQASAGGTGELAELVQQGRDDIELQLYFVMDPIREMATMMAEMIPLEALAPELASLSRVPAVLQHVQLYIDFTTPQSGAIMKLTGRDFATTEELETAVLDLIDYLATVNSRSFFEEETNPQRDEAMEQYRARLAKEMRETLQPTREGDEITLSTAGKAYDFRVQARWMIGNITSVTLPIFDMYRLQRQSAQTQHMLEIGLAMHNHHDTFGRFPPGPEVKGEAKSGLSWRVHLLPFLGEHQLYEEFKLDEPWDSEHNLKLVEKMPHAYASRGHAAPVAEGKTQLQLPLGQGLPGSVAGRLSFADIRDGSSNTIMVVEAPAEKAVIWTKPEDLEVDLEDPAASLADGDGFSAVMYDGSVRQIPADVDKQTLKAWLTHAGGEIVP